MSNIALLDERIVLGKSFRVYGTPDEPLFAARDVAEWIEHSNPTEMVRGIDADEKLNSTILSSGQNREVTFLTEDGLYEVLMQSRKPIAKQFKRQVKEILKSIRRHGVYATPAAVEAMLQDPDTMIRTLQALKEERRQKAALQAQVAYLTPPAQAWNALAEAKGDYSLRGAAQILSRDPSIDTGQNRLMKYLRQLRWVDRSGTPYQVQIDNGRLAVRTSSYTHPHTGDPVLTSQLRVTVKGLTKLHALLGGTSPLQIPSTEEVA